VGLALEGRKDLPDASDVVCREADNAGVFDPLDALARLLGSTQIVPNLEATHSPRNPVDGR
jgi:hypothetical protein